MQQERRSILIVDSSPSFIFYVAMLLKKLQYEVKTATTAEDALTLIARSAPAAVITDTVLPVMSGVDLLKQLKKNPSLSFIPVIMHTEEKDPAVRGVCISAGCAGYFLKPVDPDVLYRALQRATEATPRQNIRIPVALTAWISSTAGDRLEEVTSLSEGGIYVKSASPEPVNATVRLKMRIRQREIPATAIVLYSSVKIGGPHAVPGMGMRFDTIAENDLAFVREFIRDHVMSVLRGESRKE